jgi:hypothetical protein
MCNKISFFEDDEMLKLSPLMQFYYHELTVETVHQKICDFQKRRFEEEKNRKADLVSKFLNDVIEEIFSFCGDESCSSSVSNFKILLEPMLIVILKI